MHVVLLQAYRLEPLINPAVVNVKPVLMPHHKGRKRLHLGTKGLTTLIMFYTFIEREGFSVNVSQFCNVDYYSCLYVIYFIPSL